MKKINKVLSFILVTIMVVALLPQSLTVSAYDYTAIIGYSEGTDIIDGSEIEDFGNLILGQGDTVLRMPINIAEFNTFDGSAPIWGQVNDTVENRMEYFYSDNEGGPYVPVEEAKEFTRLFARVLTFGQASPVENPTIKLTGMNVGEIDGYLKIRYRLGNSDDPVAGTDFEFSKAYKIKGAFIDPTVNNHIKEISGDNLITKASYILHNDQLLWKRSEMVGIEDQVRSYFLNLNVQPGDEFKFVLNTNHFQWSTRIDEMVASVRKSSLDNDQISAIETVIAGQSLIESIRIENVDMYYGAVVIRFKEDFNSVKEREFDFNVALGQRGFRNVPSGGDFAGTFGNRVWEVDQDNDYVFIGDGTIAEALSFVRNIELDTDNGVSVFANLKENRRYYGRSYMQPTQDDREIMNYFPSIRFAVTLKVTNVDKDATHVKITQDGVYYVYDADGKYLGDTTEKLPYRSKYYLSANSINMEGEIDDIPFDAAEGENPPTGGSQGGIGTNLIGLVITLAGGLTIGLSKKNRRKEEEEK